MTDTAVAPQRTAATGERPERPVRPRDAASVLVVRGEGAGAEILMGRRASRRAFAADIWAFPGGGVDAADGRVRVDATPDPVVDRVLGAKARALALTAVRELHEETGLVLGRPGEFAAPASHPGWVAFAATGMAPALDRLGFLARAITPASSPIRFHARFFHVRAEDLTGTFTPSREFAEMAWVRVDDALRLPIWDVTEFVLDRMRKVLVDGDHTPGPLLTYRNERARLVYPT